ncbi:hypothetical protein ACFV1W_05755 [Kitasatospora sp. NPDC059648]|uniref:hypothetical protein n=1 Tax=Kitasatospora sp. NPDC059648 TaxID=3346894 RepID=UPI0036A7B436
MNPDYVPLGALEQAGVSYGGGRQVTRSAVLDDWLAGVGAEVYRAVPFSLAVIGWEVSDFTHAAALGGRAPDVRQIGYLLPQPGGDVRYAAANL